MRGMFIWIVALFMAVTICPIVQGQSDLEGQIKHIFLYQPEYGEKYDRKAKIEELGRSDEVKTILLRMLVNYKYSEPGTSNVKEYSYLTGAVSMLGALQEPESVSLLSLTLFDRNVHENVRALAVKSLGQIDPEGSKQSLLKALANISDYYLIRIYAAEALAKTTDPQVLKTLERYGRAEKDAYVRQRFDNATRELRARIRSGN